MTWRYWSRIPVQNCLINALCWDSNLAVKFSNSCAPRKHIPSCDCSYKILSYLHSHLQSRVLLLCYPETIQRYVCDLGRGVEHGSTIAHRDIRALEVVKGALESLSSLARQRDVGRNKFDVAKERVHSVACRSVIVQLNPGQRRLLWADVLINTRRTRPQACVLVLFPSL